MKAITFRRFNGLGICGDVDIPTGTELPITNGFVVFDDGRLITRRHSDNYIKHFANNDDGNGLERGRLTYAIAFSPREHQNENPFRFTEEEAETIVRNWGKYLLSTGSLVFNNAFYEAPIEDLRKIASALGLQDAEIYNID